MAADGGQWLAGDEHARAFDQAFVDRPPEREAGDAGRAEVAHRGEASAQRDQRIMRAEQRQIIVRVDRAAPEGRARIADQMDMGIDQAGQDRAVRKIDQAGAGWRREKPGRDALNPAIHNGDGGGSGDGPGRIGHQTAGMDDNRLVMRGRLRSALGLGRDRRDGGDVQHGHQTRDHWHPPFSGRLHDPDALGLTRGDPRDQRGAARRQRLSRRDVVTSGRRQASHISGSREHGRRSGNDPRAARSSALARLETAVRLVDDVGAAPAADHAAVTVTRLQGLQGIADLHGARCLPVLQASWLSEKRGAHLVGRGREVNHRRSAANAVRSVLFGGILYSRGAMKG